MSETANGTSGGSGLAPLIGRAESLWGSLGARLKDARAGLTEAPATATEAAFSDGVPPAVAQAEARMRPATARAEETLDQAGERLGAFAAAVGHQIRKAAALAREEAEDIWAEAQSLRQKETQ